MDSKKKPCLGNKRKKNLCNKTTIKEFLSVSSKGSEVKDKNITIEASSSDVKLEMDDSFDLFIPNKILKLKINKEFNPEETIGKEKSDFSNNKMSGYFNERPKEKTHPTKQQCPICLLSFVSLKLHLSRCTKKNHISEKALDDAFKLQSEFIERRGSIGLPSVVGNQNDNDKEKEAEEQDLKKAIELSLLEQNSGTEEKPCSSKFCAKPTVSTRSGKLNKSKKPLLLLRSSKERQNIITEKLAIVLMDGEDDNNGPVKSKCVEINSVLLQDCHNEESKLWRKSSLGPDCVKKTDFYVKQLEPFVEPAKTPSKPKPPEPKVETEDLELEPSEIGDQINPDTKYFPDQSNDSNLCLSPPLSKKLDLETGCNVSSSVEGVKNEGKIDEQLFTLERSSNGDSVTNFQDEGNISLRVDSCSSTSPIEFCNKTNCFSENSAICSNFPMNKSNAFQNVEENYRVLCKDWEVLVGNAYMSDITIQLEEGSTFCVHGLVLFARCQAILKDVQDTDRGYKVISWEEVSYEVCTAFMRFVYCGDTQHLGELSRQVLKEVKKLCVKYGITSLDPFLPEEIVGQNLFSQKHGNIDNTEKETEFVEENISQTSTIGVISNNPIEEHDCENNFSETSTIEFICDTSEHGKFSTIESDDRTRSPELFCPSPENTKDSSKFVPASPLNQVSTKKTLNQKECVTVESSSEDAMEVATNAFSPRKKEMKTEFKVQTSFSFHNNSFLDSIQPLNSPDFYQDPSPKNTSFKNVESFIIKSSSEDSIEALAPWTEEAKTELKIQSNFSPENSFLDGIQALNSPDFREEPSPKNTSFKDLDSFTIGSSSEDTPEKRKEFKIGTSFSLENSFLDSIKPLKSSDVDRDPSPLDSIKRHLSKRRSSDDSNSDLFNTSKRLREEEKSPLSQVINLDSDSDTKSPDQVDTQKIDFSDLFNSHTYDCDDMELSQNKRSEPFDDDEIESSVPAKESELFPGSANRNSFQNLPEENVKVTKEGSDIKIRATKRLKVLSKSVVTPIRGLPMPPLSTPSPQLIVSDEVTPQQDYALMLSPQLKNELRKYGLKPNLKRNKAEMLLKYIYEQIHPVVGGGKATTSRVQPGTPRIISSPSCSSDSDSFGEEYLEVDEPNEHIDTKSDFDTMFKIVSNFIKGNDDLLEAVVSYVPIWLHKFHSLLKQQGIKISINMLMDILDEACIAFRNEKSVEARKRKNVKRKKRAKTTNFK